MFILSGLRNGYLFTAKTICSIETFSNIIGLYILMYSRCWLPIKLWSLSGLLISHFKKNKLKLNIHRLTKLIRCDYELSNIQMILPSMYYRYEIHEPTIVVGYCICSYISWYHVSLISCFRTFRLISIGEDPQVFMSFIMDEIITFQ